MPLVRLVIVARIRCWWTPWPNWTRRVAVEAHVRDVAAGGLVDERLRGGPEGEPLGHADQALELRHEVEVEGRVVRRDEVVDQPDGLPAGLDPDLLLAVLEDHVVAAVLAGAAGLAVADVRAGEVLELQGDVLGHVAGPGPVAEPRDEPAAPAEGAGVVLEGGQQLDEGVDEARDPVARELLEHAQVHHLADHRLLRPVVGAAQDAGLEDAQGGLGAQAARDRVRGSPPRRGRGSGGRAVLAARSRVRCAAVFLDRFGEAGSACATWCPPRVRGSRSVRAEASSPAQAPRARRRQPTRPAAQLEAISPSMTCRFGAATRIRRRRSKR